MAAAALKNKHVQNAAMEAAKNEKVQAAAKQELEKQAKAELGLAGDDAPESPKKEKKEKRGSVLGWMGKKAKGASDAVATAVKDVKDTVKGKHNEYLNQKQEEREQRAREDGYARLQRLEANTKAQEQIPVLPNDVASAAEKGDQAAVIAWLDANASREGYSIDTRTEQPHGRTLVHHAARKGQVDMLRMLIERGADVNLDDACACPAIHYAALNGEVAAARLLLDSGADAQARGSLGHTALMYAAQYNDVPMLELLLERSMNEGNDEKNPPFFLYPDAYGDIAQHYAAINFARECHVILDKMRREHYTKTLGLERKLPPPLDNPCYYQTTPHGGPIVVANAKWYGPPPKHSGNGLL